MAPVIWFALLGGACLQAGSQDVFQGTIQAGAQPTASATEPIAPEAAAVNAVQTPAKAVPQIDSVNVFSGTPTSTDKAAVPQIAFILQMNGEHFDAIDDISKVRVIPFPAAGVKSVSTIAKSADGTKLLAQFTAPSSYILQQVALSLDDKTFITFDTKSTSCDFANNVTVSPQLVPYNQNKDKYGDGVAKYFYVIQLSAVNKCSMPIDMPLAGISVIAAGSQSDENCNITDTNSSLVPFSLAHLTSIYSADRKLTGKRAIFFNGLLAAVTIGSSIQPFFGHGFAQGVAILGGGFTTAAKEVLVDMSAEQLQNITSQSFGAVEQVPSGGSLQKFVFVQRLPKCVGKNKPNLLDSNMTKGNFDLTYEVIPASAQAPNKQTAPAIPPAAAAKK